MRFSSFIFEAALLYFAVTLGLDVALIILVLINILLNQVLIRFILKDRKTGYFLAAGKFSLWLVFLLLLFFIK